MGGTQTKQLGGFRVCNFGENSLGRLLELEISFDYIVGIDGVPLTQVSDASHDFFLKRLKGIGKYPVKINVYNSLSTRIRTIILNPHRPIEKSQEIFPGSRRSSADLEKDGYGPGKNILSYGIESNMIEFDAPLNSLRVYQFLSCDQRISGLGVGVHWEEISAKGIRVVNVQESSPAQASGLTSNDDFIVASSTLMRPFYSTDDFLAFVRKNDNIPLSLTVYNTETETTREVSITPKSSWGGKGLLGCDIAAGPLYDIPLREKEASFSKLHQGNITYIEISSDSRDGQGPVQYFLKEESEVYPKNILLEEDERAEYGSSGRQNPEFQSNETPRGHILVKDYSFDSYRTKQQEETTFDEKQGIIEQALISTGFPDQSARGIGETPHFQESQEDGGNPIGSSKDCTLESLLIISNLNEEKDPDARPRTVCRSSDVNRSDEDENKDGFSENTLLMGHLRQIHEVSEPPSVPPPDLPSPPHQTYPELTPNEYSEAPRPLPEPPSSSPGDFPAFPRNSEDSVDFCLHAKAGSGHVTSGQVERELPSGLGLGAVEGGGRKCGVGSLKDVSAVNLGSDDLGSQKEDAESGRNQNGQNTRPDSVDCPTGTLGSCERTQDEMSPEDKRAYEILKKLMEVSPRLDYEPPGRIEYTD